MYPMSYIYKNNETTVWHVLLGSYFASVFISVPALSSHKMFSIRHLSNPTSTSVRSSWHPLLTVIVLLVTRCHLPGQQPSNLPIDTRSVLICASQICWHQPTNRHADSCRMETEQSPGCGARCRIVSGDKSVSLQHSTEPRCYSN